MAIVCELCMRVKDKSELSLQRNAVNQVDLLFPEVSKRTIYRIWSQYRNQRDKGRIDLRLNRKGRCGRKSNLSVEIQSTLAVMTQELKREVTYDQHTAILKDRGVECCRTRVWNWCQSMGALMETSYIKPCLTEKHCIERLRFILNLIKQSYPYR